MSRKPVTLAAFFLLIASNFAAAQVVVPGFGGPVVVPPAGQFIPPSYGQHPVYVSPNEVVGINPITGGIDTQNRQIDNTAYQYGRNSSQYNGTKRWVRRPIRNAQGQVVGYQEGYVWRNSYTGQEHGELNNYTPNGLGGVNSGHQSRSAGGVHRNNQIFSKAPSGVHKNRQSYSVQRPSGVHKNIQSFSVRGK